MKKGFGIFGKAYEIMLRNDLHDKTSVDYCFLEEMTLLEEASYQFLYESKPPRYSMYGHELYGFSQQFRKDTEHETVQAVIGFTSGIAYAYSEPLENMRFGGTEKQIIERGTDWCADMTRVAAVLLDCLDIPCRILHLINPDKAYNGHAAIEAYYENQWGVIDPIYGWVFHKIFPLSAWELMHAPENLDFCGEDYRGLYKAVAVNEYNPMDITNRYTVSRVNRYYMNLLSVNHSNHWIMGEDKDQ